MKRKTWRNVLLGAVLMLGVAGLLFMRHLQPMNECLDRGGTWWLKENKCTP